MAIDDIYLMGFPEILKIGNNFKSNFPNMWLFET